MFYLANRPELVNYLKMQLFIFRETRLKYAILMHKLTFQLLKPSFLVKVLYFVKITNHDFIAKHSYDLLNPLMVLRSIQKHFLFAISNNYQAKRACSKT